MKHFFQDLLEIVTKEKPCQDMESFLTLTKENRLSRHSLLLSNSKLSSLNQFGAFDHELGVNAD